MYRIIKKASSLVLNDENSKENCRYSDENEVVFCKNNVCVHVKSGKNGDFSHCPGYLTCKSAAFVDQHIGSRRQTLVLTWIPNHLLCAPSTPLSVSSDRKSILENSDISSITCDNIKTKNSGDFIEGISELKSELQPLLAEYSSIDSIKDFLINKSVTTAEIIIANPMVENRSYSQTCMNQGTIRYCGESSINEVGNIVKIYDSAALESVANYDLNLEKHGGSYNRFSFDLCKLRSLRIVFVDERCTSGHLILVSREPRCKILHFHCGGLDNLAKILHRWHCVLHTSSIIDQRALAFVACRPDIMDEELHPDEFNIKKLTTNFFYGELLNEDGRIKEESLLRKLVFFGRLEENLRKIVWPFLLRCYSYSTTFEERNMLLDIKRDEYEMLTRKRLYSLSPEELLLFWKDTQGVVENDIARCDQLKSFPGYAEKITADVLKNILLNYAVYNPNIRYFLGMLDLLIPIHNHIQTESETFWCFVGLMQTTLVGCAYSKENIERHIIYLRELIRILLPAFYNHICNEKSIDLHFSWRWLQSCFKYQFTDRIVIQIWEACWTNFLTDYFHIFVCLAIIAVYANDVIAQNMSHNEISLYFNSLTMYIDGALIIRKARGLLHEFRTLSKIPCTLTYLCKRVGPGIYDSVHNPTLECTGHSNKQTCNLSAE